MNFSREYIELCDDDRIQKLRPYKRFENYDFVTMPAALDDLFVVVGYRNNALLLLSAGYNETHEVVYWDEFLWLPTGDQLDRAITNICKEKKWSYRIDIDDIRGYETVCEVFDYNETDPDMIGIADTQASNPLVAKIKLLIKLLEYGK